MITLTSGMVYPEIASRTGAVGIQVGIANDLLKYSETIAIPIFIAMSLFIVTKASINATMSHSPTEIIHSLIRVMIFAGILSAYTTLWDRSAAVFKSVDKKVLSTLNHKVTFKEGEETISIPIADEDLSTSGANLLRCLQLKASGHTGQFLDKDTDEDEAGYLLKAATSLAQVVILLFCLTPFVTLMSMVYINGMVMALVYGVGPIMIAFAVNQNLSAMLTNWLNTSIKSMMFVPILRLVLGAVLLFLSEVTVFSIAKNIDLTSTGISTTIAAAFIPPMIFITIAQTCITGSAYIMNSALNGGISNSMELVRNESASVVRTAKDTTMSTWRAGKKFAGKKAEAAGGAVLRASERLAQHIERSGSSLAGRKNGSEQTLSQHLDKLSNKDSASSSKGGLTRNKGGSK